MLDLRDRVAVAALIEARHWHGDASLRALERELGLAHSRLQRWCRVHGIAVRRQRDAAARTGAVPDPPPGGVHPCTQRVGAPAAGGDARAERHGRNVLPHERLVCDALAVAGAVVVAPYLVEPYLLDFAFLSAQVDLEIDGRGHCSRHALVRDAWLIERGWTIVRVQQDRLWNARAPTPIVQLGKLFGVLEHLVAGLDLVRTLPPGRPGQYRVLVRDREYPAGRRL